MSIIRGKIDHPKMPQAKPPTAEEYRAQGFTVETFDEAFERTKPLSYIEERNKESKQVVVRDCMVCFEDGADWCLQSSVVQGLAKELQELYISIYGEPVASCAISNYEAAVREAKGES